MDYIAEIMITGIVVIIALTFHEYAHGLASYAQGDNTAKYEGRLTLNPFAHIDLAGLLMLLIVKFGWAKPVPINSYYYKNPRRGIIITSIAGPFANILLAFLSYLTYYLISANGIMLSEGMDMFFVYMVVLNINFAIFNLLPIPPLDGSKIFAEIFGGKVREAIYKIDNRGILILFVILLFPPTKQLLSSATMAIMQGMEYIIFLFV
ncbi:MAG: site-2 protease family protein [Clostridium sp.]|uniref:site-2 protease family protein n=1 Tax=Clostridium sp. TaxID=1506 RepID=UPI002FC8AC9B